jgi:transposase
MPLGYEVFAGNRVDVTTVEEIVGTMEARYGLAERVWVMDRGMTSAENIAWLQQTGRRYLIGTAKSELKRFAREVADARDWQAVRDGVEAKTSEELWRTYIQLTEAEAVFRIHKSDLSIRPIWHQKAERVQAHILVCFLAYVLWKTLEQWQRRAGLGNSPRTILEEIGRIQSTDVVLPLAEKPGRELRIRCVVRPDPVQAMLLDRLGIVLPERLRIPSRIDGM